MQSSFNDFFNRRNSKKIQMLSSRASVDVLSHFIYPVFHIET